ncbi:PAS domain S-box protein [Verrucomicrobiaceae bacterium N1E253]|uniref:PAS domain S-box protein n=1 Tax=Oceaniferula marina TaxID=2748318 RepID=A0A851GPM9_9BACT|nr:PAS domain-containing protein [Oceaniferula marina]NWK56967.1 PAS domain S-box protein [Oceaniferula marina]
MDSPTSNIKASLLHSEEDLAYFLKNSTEQIWCLELDQPLQLDTDEMEQARHLFKHAYLTDVNESFAKLYGLSVAEMNGQRLEKIMPEELPSTMPTLLRAVRAKFDVVDFETIEQDKDGREIRVLNNFIPLIENNQLIRLWGTARDITQLRRTEESNRLRSLAIETMRDGCVIVDAKAKGMPILYHNKQFTTITGYDSPDTVGKNCRFLQGPETSLEQLLLIRQAVNAAKPYHGELLNYRKDGSTFWNYLQIAPVFDDHHELSHFVGIISDVTQRKQSETLLHTRNKQLKQEADQRHQIQRDLERLGKKLVDTRESEKRYLARELHDDVTQRLAAMALDIKRIAQQSSLSQQATKRELLSLGQKLGELAVDTQELSRQLHPKILEDLGLNSAIRSKCLRFKKRTGIPVHLLLHPSSNQLDQEQALCAYRVLQEALTNIHRHAEASKVHIELIYNNRSATLTIKDDGIGFDLKSAKNQESLGLVSISERVRLSNGHLNIHSKPLQGTMLKIELPLTKRHNPHLK